MDQPGLECTGRDILAVADAELLAKPTVGGLGSCQTGLGAPQPGIRHPFHLPVSGVMEYG